MLTRRHLMFGFCATPFLFPTSLTAATVHPDLVVQELARVTRERYQDERLGRRIADQLLLRLGQGAFASLADAGKLAGALNRLIGETSRDLHFMVMGEAMGGPQVPPTPPHSPVPPLTVPELHYLKTVSFGIAKTELLDRNVGRLEVRHFYRPADEVRAAVAAAMRKLAGTSALIVDLSNNPGGDPRAVAHILSYFFDRPSFVVNRFHLRNRPVEEFRTERDLPGPRYGEARPLIVQVSPMSFSAAEEFAYDIQALKRGIVVGQVTGGGANHALPVDLPGGMQAYIPQARAENPVTGTNWEGSGVQPDHRVAPHESSKASFELAVAQLRRRR